MLTVIFDMDGTLLDTQRIHNDSWDYAGGLQGYDGLNCHLAEVCGMNEAGWTRYLEERYPDLDLQRFKADCAEYVRDHMVPVLKPGAKELLDFLKEKGVPMAVASGTKISLVRSLIAQAGLAEYFSFLFGGEQVQRCKPAPDIYLMAAEALGAEPADCVVVEDAINGVRSAHAAGMRCIGVPDIAPLTGVKDLLYDEVTSLDQIIDVLADEVG